MAKVQIDLTKLPKITNPVYIPLYRNESRYLVLYGGAGSGKSVFIGQKIIYKCLTGQHNFLIVRQTGNTNRLSTFPLIKKTINSWGMTDLFKINESDMRIKCKLNGNEIAFAGLDDVEKLKSITFENGDLTDIWVEEATEIDEDSFKQLDIRLRGLSKTPKQIILSFNPVSVTSWIKTFIEDRLGLAPIKNSIPITKDNFTVLKTTYIDNNFIDEEYKKLLESMKKDPYHYAVYCLGEWGVVGRTVFDVEKVTERLAQLRTQNLGTKARIELKDGKYIYVPDNNGMWTIYYPPQNRPYVAGADVAEGLEHGDYDGAHILDNITLRQEAVFHGHLDVDRYAEELNKGGKYYNNALLTVEANFNPGIILNLEKMGYSKQYMRETQDSITHAIQKKFGWKTTEINRRVILSNLIEYVRDHCNLINDIPTLEEMLVFVRNEKGRMEAQSGKHDDLVMSLAIALEAGISGQQTKSTGKKQVDQKKIAKLAEDLRQDYYNATTEQKEYLAEKWNLWL